jgi:hypothetical protein
MKRLSDMKKQPSLLFCLAMDLIGMMTYAVPVFGEFADVLWAPLSALIFYRTFGGNKGMIGGAFAFLEEILPGFDFIPSFTIMYFLSRKRSTVSTALVK